VKPLSPRRLLAGALTIATAGTAALVTAAVAAPAAGADTCILVCLPGGTGSGSGGLPIPISTSGGTTTIAGLPVSLGGTGLPVLGSGAGQLPVIPSPTGSGFTFPTGQTSVTFTPALLRNDAKGVQAVITDPLAPLYVDGESVSLTSPQGQTVPGQVTSTSGSTINATFDLLSGSTLADAGSYTLNVVPTDPTSIVSQLQSALGGLLPGGGQLSLPSDSVSGVDVYGRTGMTLAASATKLVAGKALTLKGALGRLPTKNVPSVAGISAVKVAIFAKPDKGAVQRIRTVTTDKNGRFSYTFKPSHDATYVAYYAGQKAAKGTIGNLPSYSFQFPKVHVTPVVKAHAVKARSSHKVPLVVRGSVSPKAAGQRVTLVRIVRGAAHKMATARVNKASRFTVTVRRLARGTYHLAVRLPAHTGNTAAASRTFAVRRT